MKFASSEKEWLLIGLSKKVVAAGSISALNNRQEWINSFFLSPGSLWGCRIMKIQMHPFMTHRLFLKRFLEFSRVCTGDTMWELPKTYLTWWMPVKVLWTRKSTILNYFVTIPNRLTVCLKFRISIKYLNNLRIVQYWFSFLELMTWKHS